MRTLTALAATLCAVLVFCVGGVARAADTTPPGPVTSAGAGEIAKTSLTLHWTNPVDADFTGVTIRRAVGATAPVNATSGLPVADVAAPGTSYTDAGLAPGVEYSYALFAHDAVPNRAAGVTVQATTTALTFTTATALTFRGSPRAISCHLTTWCMLVDDSGQWQHYNGSSWSAPVRLFQAEQGSGFIAISCPALTFCMALTALGDAYIWSGLQWSGPTHVIAGFAASISCPVANVCWTVAGHYAYKYDNGTWTKQLVAGLAGAALASIACATSSACVAVGNRNTGGAYAWHWVAGGPWSGPTSLFTDAGDEIWAVACAASNNCLAVGDQTWYSHFDGRSWSAAHMAIFSSGVDLTSVSCPAVTFCAAAGSTVPGFAVMQWSAGRWSAATTITASNAYGDAVSCATASMCLAANQWGQVSRWSGSSWDRPSTVDRTSGYLGGIACPVKTSCAGLDEFGNVVGFDGHTWGPPRPVGGNLLACPQTTFCLTLDTLTGAVREHVGTSWPVVVTLNPPPYVMTCAGPTFCLGVSGAAVGGVAGNTTVTLNGTQWGYAAHEPLTDVVGLSCPSRFWCMAVDLTGHSAIYDRGHSRWLAGPALPAGSQPQRVECASTTFCLAVLQSSVVRYDGHTWTLVTGSDPNVLPSCLSVDFCVLDDLRGYTTYSFGAVAPGAGYDGSPEIGAMSCLDPVEPFCVGVGGSTAVVGQ